MNPKTIRKLDKWVGGTICLLLTLLNNLVKLFSKERNRIISTKKVLFIKLIEQGATVVAYSAIKKSIEMVGKENVFFCVFIENKPILELLNVIPTENILTVRQDNVLIFIKDVIKTLYKLRKIRIDTTIDMEFFSRSSAIISYLTGAEKRIGYHRFNCEYPYRGDLMTHKIEYNPYIHIGKAYQLLAESINMDKSVIPLPKIDINSIKLVYPEFKASKEEQENILNLIRKEKGSDIKGLIIILNPNASDIIPLRKWEASKFIELTKLLVEFFNGITIIITGASYEVAAAADLYKQIKMPEVINLAGKTSLRDLFVLYSVSDILVTNDSGPSHFSSATNIHSIVLFGPETPLLWGPISKNVHYVQIPLTCSPCINALNHRFSPCNDNICMKLIKAKQVFDIIVKIANENNSGKNSNSKNHEKES